MISGVPLPSMSAMTGLVNPDVLSINASDTTSWPDHNSAPLDRNASSERRKASGAVPSCASTATISGKPSPSRSPAANSAYGSPTTIGGTAVGRKTSTRKGERSIEAMDGNEPTRAEAGQRDENDLWLRVLVEIHHDWLADRGHQSAAWAEAKLHGWRGRRRLTVERRDAADGQHDRRERCSERKGMGPRHPGRIRSSASCVPHGVTSCGEGEKLAV